MRSVDVLQIQEWRMDVIYGGLSGMTTPTRFGKLTHLFHLRGVAKARSLGWR